MGITVNNNMISRGALVLAALQVTTAALVGISNKSFSEFEIYVVLGLFLLLVFLHVFMRDENFDTPQAINNVSWILSIKLAVLSLYAFIVGAYLAMFICVGFFIVFYLAYLMQNVFQLEVDKKR